MRTAGLDELEAGIKIGGRNINNLRDADDTIIMTESEEDLKNLLMRAKESEKAGLKLNIQKSKIMAPALLLHCKHKGKGGSSDRFPVLGLSNHCGWLLKP